MKRIITLTIVIILLISATCAFAIEAKLAKFKGDVSVKLPEGKFMAAKENMILPEGTVIQTGFDGLAFVVFDNKTIIRFKEMTIAQLDNMIDNQEKYATDIKILQGKVLAQVEREKNRKVDFKIITRYGIAGVKGTVLELTTGLNGYTTKVSEGKVINSDLTGNSKSVSSGQSVSTKDKQNTSKSVEMKKEQNVSSDMPGISEDDANMSGVTGELEVTVDPASTVDNLNLADESEIIKL